MHRLAFVALIASAFGITAASAQSMSPSYSGSDNGSAQSAPVRVAANGNMGGGFIEYVFGDPRRPAQAAPPARFDPSMPVEEPQYQQQQYQAPPPAMAPQAVMQPGYGQGYYALPQPAPVAGVPRQMDPRFFKQEVPYGGQEKPGTVVIDTPSKFLYLVQPGGRALRYGIGVGRPGFTWAGTKTVSAKREWPDWRPPDEMLQRRPDLPRYMPGGPDNPLGARALYLGSSLYRIHGSNEPWTIGQQVSSGCIRMRNEDVIDLYGRVPVGAKVIVI